MNTRQSFEKLEGAVARIAGHASYPEKHVTLSACLDDIESRFAQGSIDLAQKRRLIAVLLGLAHPSFAGSGRDPAA